MRNDDPEYVAHLEAALESAEKEITDNRNEANELHRIIAEMSERLNPTHMGEPAIAARAALTEGMEPRGYMVITEHGAWSIEWAYPDRRGWSIGKTPIYTADQLAAVRLQERERCAKIVEDGPFAGTRAGDAAAIRNQVKMEREI